MKQALILLLFASPALAGEGKVKTLPPDRYDGIQLITSKLGDIVAKYGEAELIHLPNDHHEEGYCYTSSNDISVIFLEVWR